MIIMYAVIRIRGTIGLKSGIRDTLEMLRLNRKIRSLSRTCC